MRKAVLLLVVLAGVMAGCEEKIAEPDPRAAGYDYYPLATGDFRIYNVTDIQYRYNVGDTSRFQLRERVDTSFYDQTNTLTYKIIRSVRPDASSQWVDDSVFVVAKTNTMVLLIKDNTPHVKLVFPVKAGVSWLGDAYNNNKANSYTPVDGRRSEYYLSKEPYSYDKVGEPFTIRDKTYSKSLTVVQGTPADTWIGYDDRQEVYAEDIGMVYRRYNRIVYCNQMESSDCEYAIGYKLNGNERHEVLTSYGHQ